VYQIITKYFPFQGIKKPSWNFWHENKPSGTYVRILKIFSPKKIAIKLAFLTNNKNKLCKNFNHNIGF
jgi:hypothetical protein